jgi:hypothetical protein
VDDGGLSALIDFGKGNFARRTSALKIKLPLAVAGTLKSPPHALNERLHSFSFGVGDDDGNADCARSLNQRATSDRKLADAIERATKGRL